MAVIIDFFQRRPALTSAFALTSGIIFERCAEVRLWWFTGIIVVLAVLYFFITHRHIRSVIILSALVCIGAGLFEIHYVYQPAYHVSRMIPHRSHVTVKGWIVNQFYLPSGATRYICAVETLVSDKGRQPVKGNIIITIEKYDDHFKYGSEIRASGVLKLFRKQRNPGEPDSKQYWAFRKIFGHMELNDEQISFSGSNMRGSWYQHFIIIPLKEKITRSIRKHFTSPERDILMALTLGVRESISPGIKEAFAATGAIHLLAISGLHVGYILLILSVTAEILRYRGIVRTSFIIAGLMLFVLLTGSSPSVVRASILGGIVTLAVYHNRRTDFWNSLGAAALLILLVRNADIFSVGFQLSFTAVSAIILSGQFVRKYVSTPWYGIPIKAKHIMSYLLSALLVSAAVTVFLWPVTGYYFQRLSVSIIFLNILLVPLTGLIVGVGFFAVILDQVLSIAAVPFFTSLDLFLKLMLGAVSFFQEIPFSSLAVSRQSAILLACVYCLIGLVVWCWWKRRLRYLLFASLGGAAPWIWTGVFMHQPPGVNVLYFDVGQGNAVLMTLPDKKRILLDAGDIWGSYQKPKSAVVDYLRREGIGELDMVLISHPDRDHMAGLLPLIFSVSIKSICFGPAHGKSKLAKIIHREAESRNIPIIKVRAGDTLISGTGYRLYLIHPTRAWTLNNPSASMNNQSLIVKVVYGENSFLFPGDAEFPAETAALRHSLFLPSDVLMVGHHGGFTSSSEQFLNTVSPRYAVISAGEGNRYGHPSPIVIRRLALAGSEPLRTDRAGAVSFFSDGSVLNRTR